MIPPHPHPSEVASQDKEVPDSAALDSTAVQHLVQPLQVLQLCQITTNLGATLASFGSSPSHLPQCLPPNELKDLTPVPFLLNSRALLYLSSGFLRSPPVVQMVQPGHNSIG